MILPINNAIEDFGAWMQPENEWRVLVVSIVMIGVLLWLVFMQG